MLMFDFWTYLTRRYHVFNEREVVIMSDGYGIIRAFLLEPTQ